MRSNTRENHRFAHAILPRCRPLTPPPRFTTASSPTAPGTSRGGVSTPRLVVTHADGARVTDADGRVFLDFAGGIGCQNTGHRFQPVVDAIKAQADDYLHQCFMVGVYEPYIETCRLLAELSPCAGERAEVDPRQLGRRGERERGQDRARRDGTARGHRLRQRLPRPHAADDDDDAQGRSRTRRGSARSRPRCTARRCRNPIAASRATTRSRGWSSCSRPRSIRRPSPASCSSRCRARAGSSRCRRDYPATPARALPGARDPLRRRRGAVRRRAHREDVGDRALRRCAPGPARLGQVDRRRPAARRRHRAAAEIMDSGPSGGLGGTFGGNPLSCAAAIAVLEAVREPEFLAQARDARRRRCAARLERSRRARPRSARCADSARCWRSSSPSRHPTARRQSSTQRSSEGCSCLRAACTGMSSGCCRR